MLTMSKYGDWTKAGIVLKSLQGKLKPFCEARLNENGELILKTLQGHLDKQDLDWTPLSENTIRLKGGDTTVLVESGFLRDNIEVRKVKAPSGEYTLFIGASAWKKHSSGVKFSDLMIWMEYGTINIPARPLIRPTWDEVEDLIKNNWKDLLSDFIAQVSK